MLNILRRRYDGFEETIRYHVRELSPLSPADNLFFCFRLLCFITGRAFRFDDRRDVSRDHIATTMACRYREDYICYNFSRSDFSERHTVYNWELEGLITQPQVRNPDGFCDLENQKSITSLIRSVFTARQRSLKAFRALNASPRGLCNELLAVSQRMNSRLTKCKWLPLIECRNPFCIRSPNIIIIFNSIRIRGKHHGLIRIKRSWRCICKSMQLPNWPDSEYAPPDRAVRGMKVTQRVINHTNGRYSQILTNRSRYE